MRRKYGTFTGGIDLAEEKHATLGAAIEPAPVARLVLPMAWGSLDPARAVVLPGQRIEPRQIIAKVQGPNSVDILAPVGGVVGQACTVAVSAGQSFRTVPAVELTDLTPLELPVGKPDWDWQGASGQQIRDRIAASTLTMHRRGGGRMIDWIARAQAAKCRTLIANCVESQPYVSADHRLLVEHGVEVIRGLDLIARALDIDDVLLAVDRRRTDAYRGVVGPCRLHKVEPVALGHKYPTGVDPILVKVLLGREVPIGKDPLQIGAAVVGADLCWAVYCAVACSQEPVGRVVTVAGERAGRCGNYFVPFGAVCRELVGTVEGTIIHGGPMTGLSCPAGAVVCPQTDSVLALEAADIGQPGPCIRCGWCGDHCPARLNVASMNDLYELGQIAQADRAGAMACVECGVCAYICPARLPLTQRVGRLKYAIERMRSSKEGA